MNVRILFFALYRDWAGTDEMVLSLPAGATAESAVAAVRDGHPGLARLPERPVVALNSVWSALDAPLRDGDELAFLPPVAGG